MYSSLELRGALRRTLLCWLASLVLAMPALAGEKAGIVITTSKPLGPAIGSFSTAGAFVDSGNLITESRTTSALPAPFGVVTHLVLRFEGGYGTFTVRADFTEKTTANPRVFADSGTWVITDGTLGYATLRGTGELTGTVDDDQNLITRILTGLVHFN
jgi:hypothetical protein